MNGLYLHRRSTGFEFGPHQPVAHSQKIEMPFTVPLDVPSAVLRNLKSTSRSGKRHHENLRATGFVGKIGEPPAVRRKLSVVLVAIDCGKPKGLEIAEKRENPNLSALIFEDLLIQGQIAAVGRPIHNEWPPDPAIKGCEYLLRPGSVCRPAAV